MLSYAARTIFPCACLSCKQELETPGLCPACWNELEFISGDICCVCGKMLPSGVTRATCAHCTTHGNNYRRTQYVKYTKAAQSILTHLKYNYCQVSTKILSKWAYAANRDHWKDIDLIVPMPSHWIRRLLRGHNIPTRISEHLSQHTQIPVSYALHCKYTQKQKGKTAEERARNVSGKFFLSESLSTQNRRIALIDDVITTGATMKEAALTLLQQGKAQYVHCIAPLATQIYA